MIATFLQSSVAEIIPKLAPGFQSLLGAVHWRRSSYLGTEIIPGPVGATFKRAQSLQNVFSPPFLTNTAPTCKGGFALAKGGGA